MVELTTPNPAAPKPVAGMPKYGWLNRLKNSVRNSIPNFSPIWVLLKTAKSKLLIPGPRSTGSTRDSEPGPKSGGAAKQAVFNHWLRWLPPAFLAHPGATFGRMLETPRFAASSGVDPEKLIFIGKPRWKVVMPSMPQPETTPFANPLMPDKNFLPWPKGRS